MVFEWDPDKDQANRDEHHLSFDEVCELFTSGDDYLEIYDEGHDEEEDRFIAIGPIRRGVVLVVFTERHEEAIRIISARIATKAEVRLFRAYKEVNRGRHPRTDRSGLRPGDSAQAA